MVISLLREITQLTASAAYLLFSLCIGAYIIGWIILTLAYVRISISLKNIHLELMFLYAWEHSLYGYMLSLLDAGAS